MLHVSHLSTLTMKSYLSPECCAIQHGAAVIIALSNYFFSPVGRLIHHIDSPHRSLWGVHVAWIFIHYVVNHVFLSHSFKLCEVIFFPSVPQQILLWQPPERNKEISPTMYCSLAVFPTVRWEHHHLKKKNKSFYFYFYLPPIFGGTGRLGVISRIIQGS